MIDFADSKIYKGLSEDSIRGNLDKVNWDYVVIYSKLSGGVYKGI